MNNTYALLRSRTFWTIVVMSLVPIVNAIVPTLPPAIQAVVELALTILAAYFHNETAVKAGARN